MTEYSVVTALLSQVPSHVTLTSNRALSWHSILQSSAPQQNGPPQRNGPPTLIPAQKPTQIIQFLTTMPITYQDIEERVIEAYEDLDSQEFPNLRATARKYGIPRGRLQRR
jgi:hypothetical protein